MNSYLLIRPLVVASVTMTLVFAMIGPGRADNIDVALFKKNKDIMEFLQKNGYKNVGVLPFRLQIGKQRQTFSAGLINGNMAERLENALILETESIGIIRDAGSVARKSDPQASYRTPDGRRNLFRWKYPLAWNERVSVAPDAFLCGKITICSDYGTVTVAIESFDVKKPGSFTKILEFGVKTDRQILADVGQGFSLWKGKGEFRRSIEAYDDVIIIEDDGEDVDAGEDAEGTDSNSDGDTPGTEVVSLDPVLPADTEEFPVKLAVLYDGKEQTLSKDPNASDVDGGATTVNMVVKDPSQGQGVTFRLRNTTRERVGVVLTVNGISTLYGEKGQAKQLKKWVLAPGSSFEIKGTYDKDHENYVPFVGLSDEDSKNFVGDFQGSAGLIHLHVFARVSGSADSNLASRSWRSLRSVSARQAPGGKVSSVDDLKQRINLTSNAVVPRGYIAAANRKEQESIGTAVLGDVEHTNTMIIRYYTHKQE